MFFLAVVARAVGDIYETGSTLGGLGWVGRGGVERGGRGPEAEQCRYSIIPQKEAVRVRKCDGCEG